MSIGSIRRKTAKIEFKNDFPRVAADFKNFAYLPSLCWVAISAYLCHTVIHSLYGSKLCQFQQPCHQRCQQPRHPAGQVPGAGLGAPHPLLRQPHPPIRFLLRFYRNLGHLLGLRAASWLHCGRRCSRCCCTTWTSTATWRRRPGGRRTGCWRSSPTPAPSCTASSSCLCKQTARADGVMWPGHKSLHLLIPGPGDDQALKTLQANISISPGGRPSSFGCSVIRARRRGRYTSCA